MDLSLTLDDIAALYKLLQSRLDSLANISRQPKGSGEEVLAQFVYEGGAWEVDCDRRELRAHGRPVPLGSPAFEIIGKLAQSAGQFVSKEELVAHVWRGAVVEENTIRVHIHAIRKALGPDRSLLQAASGRGYRLLGSWAVRQSNDFVSRR
ncbi:MAG: winged helix-turn-helix transcriptional regulator [Alphaproteobacteria bacterium]|nr:winged helix-turn-helix transcriptional regulator [Alphaproteobacteria bacterium]